MKTARDAQCFARDPRGCPRRRGDSGRRSRKCVHSHTQTCQRPSDCGHCASVGLSTTTGEVIRTPSFERGRGQLNAAEKKRLLENTERRTFNAESTFSIGRWMLGVERWTFNKLTAFCFLKLM